MKRILCEFLIQNAFRHQVGPSATPADGASHSPEGAAHVRHVTVFTGNGVPCLHRVVTRVVHKTKLFPIVVLPFTCFFFSALLFLSEWPDLFCTCTPLAGANIWTPSFELYIILCATSADNVA